MNEETTRNMPDGRSFEERVFARFDAVDARLLALEHQAERRALETKPIWERALSEILELRQSLANVERKIDILSRDVVQVRADQAHVEDRLERLESKPVR